MNGERLLFSQGETLRERERLAFGNAKGERRTSNEFNSSLQWETCLQDCFSAKRLGQKLPLQRQLFLLSKTLCIACFDFRVQVGKPAAGVLAQLFATQATPVHK
ncbi:hypothetical protein [Dendronalium phyllosphericum]|uniref:hypothetical protein n=1 Tax=Dendronalium phyllosphericum TaxID=2840445 RepID=UPI001CEDFEBA|nr:hypothetical protein [Dendronalium phyllosphericum]